MKQGANEMKKQFKVIFRFRKGNRDKVEEFFINANSMVDAHHHANELATMLNLPNHMMEIRDMGIAPTHAIALNDILSLDWNDNEVVVAKKGDKVKINQMDNNIIWIECDGWEFYVATSLANLEILKGGE
jgi:hypothetical protein